MKSFRFIIAIALSLMCGMISFLYSGSFTYPGSVIPGSWSRDIKIPYEVDKIAYQATAQIYFPKGYEKGEDTRTLIVLHGYNQNLRVWELNSDIERYADLHGLVLVCPDMGKTLYETEYYPETTVKWAPMPGGKFVAETLIDYLRGTFNIANGRSTTGILGLSTGGRGAIMLAAKYPDKFAAAAGLSGDYDPTVIPNDRLLATVYGNYEKNQERWERVASVINAAEGLKNTPIFLSHGGKDFVVSKEQSIILAIRLKQLQKEQGGYSVTFKEKRYKMHDWSFWASMVPEMMRFFDEKLAK